MGSNKHKRVSSVEYQNGNLNLNKRVCGEQQQTGFTENCEFVNVARGDLSHLKAMKLSGSDCFSFFLHRLNAYFTMYSIVKK